MLGCELCSAFFWISGTGIPGLRVAVVFVRFFFCFEWRCFIGASGLQGVQDLGSCGFQGFLSFKLWEWCWEVQGFRKHCFLAGACALFSRGCC